MKKIYLLIAIISVLTLAGCGTTKETKKEDNLNVVNQQKRAFIETNKQFIYTAINKINEGYDIRLFDTRVLLMLPVGDDTSKSCIRVESGGSSPFNNGDWKYAYVGVVYDGTRYSYYLVSEDLIGNGRNLWNRNEINNNAESFLYLNNEGKNTELSNFLTEKYSIKNNDIHNLTDVEKTYFKKILDEYPKLEKIVYVAGGSNCRYK